MAFTDEELLQLPVQRQSFTDAEVMAPAGLTAPTAVPPQVGGLVPPEDPGVIEVGLKSLGRGAVGIASGAGAAAEWFGDVGKVRMAQEAGRGLQEATERVLQQPALRLEGETFEGTFMENPSFKRAFGITMEALPSLGAALATGGGAAAGLTRLGMAAPKALKIGSALAAGGLGLVEGAPQYIEAKEAGKTLGTASAIGGAATVGTAALEFLGLGRIFGMAGRGAVRGGLSGTLSEGVQEGTQQLWQNIVAKVGYDEGRSLFEGMAEAIIGGAGAGGIAGTVTGRVDAKRDTAQAEMLKTELGKQNISADIDVTAGVATIARDTPAGKVTSVVPVNNLAPALAAGMSIEEFEAATETVTMAVHGAKEEGTLPEQVVEEAPKARVQIDETAADSVNVTFPSGTYAYTPREGMTVPEMHEATKGMKTREKIAWLKANADVTKIEEAPVDITEPAGDQVVEPEREARVAEEAAPAEEVVRIEEPTVTEERPADVAEAEVVAPAKAIDVEKETPESITSLVDQGIEAMQAETDVETLRAKRESFIAKAEGSKALEPHRERVLEAYTRREQELTGEPPTVTEQSPEEFQIPKDRVAEDPEYMSTEEITVSRAMSQEQKNELFEIKGVPVEETIQPDVADVAGEVPTVEAAEAAPEPITERVQVEAETPAAPEAKEEAAEAEYTPEQLKEVEVEVDVLVANPADPKAPGVPGTMRENAADAIAEVDQRTERYNKLLECLVS